MKFQDSVIVVTGGLKGIGKACTDYFLKEGAKVAVWTRSLPDGVSDGDFQHDGRLIIKKVDVAVAEQVQAATEATISALGDIHHLIQNAGIQGEYTSATEITHEEWDRVMNTNLLSNLWGAKYVIPSMRRVGGGCIVNMASVNSFHCQKNTVAYATSKAAQLGLTRSIAVDYAPEIRCVAVCPGAVDTPMLDNALASIPDIDKVMKQLESMHLTNRIGKPEEVAGLVGYLCSPEGAFITGQAIRIDGGLGIALGGN